MYVDVRRPPPVATLVDRAGVGQVAEDLNGKERVATGLGQHRVAQRHSISGHFVPCNPLQQCQQLVVAEPLQGDPFDPAVTMQRRQHIGERMRRVDIGVTECP